VDAVQSISRSQPHVRTAALPGARWFLWLVRPTGLFSSLTLYGLTQLRHACDPPTKVDIYS